MTSVQQGRALIARLPRVLGLLLVRGYQVVISPWLPPTCRFYPSCSAYCVTAVTRHGLLWGSALTGWRLLRCNPWTCGGVDDVPQHGFTGPDGVGLRCWQALGRKVGSVRRQHHECAPRHKREPIGGHEPASVPPPAPLNSLLSSTATDRPPPSRPRSPAPARTPGA